MSKIKINEIESASTDLAVTPTGTDGALEVANEDQQSSIQLNDSLDVHKVKVKGPANTASQDYTLVLPATNITADKFLKVDSLTGSGSTATAQLGYHTFTPADENNLVGSSFTSGEVPSTRYSLTGANGAGLKFIQRQTVSNATTSIINFTGLGEGMYKVIAKNLDSSGSTVSMGILAENGNNITNLLQWEYLYYDGDYWSGASTDYYIGLSTGASANSSHVFEIYIKEPTVSNRNPCWGIYRGDGAGSTYDRVRGYFSLIEVGSTDGRFRRFHGIQFRTDVPGTTFMEQGGEVSLFKYQD